VTAYKVSKLGSQEAWTQ